MADKVNLELIPEDYRNVVNCLYAAAKVFQAFEILGIQANVGSRIPSKDIEFLAKGIALNATLKPQKKPVTPDLRGAEGVIVDPGEPGESPFAQFLGEGYKLCYVRDSWAWFTTQPIAEQWGDDWDDAPYEHNAGSPYEGDSWKIKKVAWEGPFDEPCEGHQNSPYSVKQINSGISPWLKSESWDNPQIKMWAGISLQKFSEIMRESGGCVYAELD